MLNVLTEAMPSPPRSITCSPFPPHIVVIGGGIAGVACVEIIHAHQPMFKITLISATTTVKAVVNVRPKGKVLREFEVKETEAQTLKESMENVDVIRGIAKGVDAVAKVVSYVDDDEVERKISYDKLCVCSGAAPNILVEGNPYVLGIRDLDSVVDFQKKLSEATRIIVIGNGGISLELVYDVDGVEVVWGIRHDVIGNAYFDDGAAKFLMPKLFESKPEIVPPTVKRPEFKSEDVDGVPVYTKNPGGVADLQRLAHLESKKRPASSNPRSADPDSASTSSSQPSTCDPDEISTPRPSGSALGPDWKEGRDMRGAAGPGDRRRVVVEYSVEVEDVLSSEEARKRGWRSRSFSDESTEEDRDWPVYVKFSNGHLWGADLVVSATGVNPNIIPLFTSSTSLDSSTTTTPTMKFDIASDGGLLIDDKMRTSLPHIFAAGDAATANWIKADNWMQMRLWSQAHQMGSQAAMSIIADLEGLIDHVLQDFCFEIFTHATKFFGFKCVLLGRFNAQGMDKDEYYLILRSTPNMEYIKLVVSNDDKIQGAVLIGETDLEETFENLIINQFDIGRFKENILEPDVDIEDYFD